MKDQTIWQFLNHVLFKQTLMFLLREREHNRLWLWSGVCLQTYICLIPSSLQRSASTAPVWDPYRLDYEHMRAGRRWSAPDSSAGDGKEKKSKDDKRTIIATEGWSSFRVSIRRGLPPGHRGNHLYPGPSSLHPSTCKDAHLQSRRWQIQRCDSLKGQFKFILLVIFPTYKNYLSSIYLRF